MKKLALLLGIAGILAASAFGFVGCDENETPPDDGKHTHSYVDGVCECGKYEADFITMLPMAQDLQAACDEQGTVERITYQTRSYALESLPENAGKELPMEKEALIYLPYGYDASQSYNIVYLMHGTGDNQVYWLEKMGTTTRNVLDNMIKDGKCEPTIFVCPTYYSVPEGYPGYDLSTNDWMNSDPNADLWPMHFWQELRSDVIPVVEAKYATYAEGDVSEENLIATRDHRAFAGLSRGSMTVVNSGMMHCLDLISTFGSYSGIWAEFEDFKAALEGEFAEYSVNYWYNGSGTADTTGGAIDNQTEFVNQALEQMPDRFKDGKNLAFTIIPGGSHAYNCWLIDLYNSMLVFFK